MFTHQGPKKTIPCSERSQLTHTRPLMSNLWIQT